MLLQVLQVAFRRLHQQVAAVFRRLLPLTRRLARPELVDGRAHKVDEDRGGDPEHRAGIHLLRAAGERLRDDDAAAEARVAAEQSRFDRETLEPRQITPSVLLQREIAGMHVQARQDARDVGEGHESGEDAELHAVGHEQADQRAGPLLAHLKRAFRGQRDLFQPAFAVELRDVVFDQRQAVLRRQRAGAARLGFVGDQNARGPAGKRAGPPPLKQLGGVRAGPA